MLEILLRNENHIVSTNVLDRMMINAVESDDKDTVQIVKNLYDKDEKTIQDKVLHIARKRGIYSVLEVLKIKSKSLEEIKLKKEEFAELIRKSLVPIAKIVPKSKDFGYSEDEIDQKILDLLSPRRGTTVEVPFKKLLQFLLPELHYQLVREDNLGYDELGSLKPCNAFCPTEEMCGVMQKAALVADYIRLQLGRKEALFKKIKPPVVVGSLKEATRLFKFGLYLT